MHINLMLCIMPLCTFYLIELGEGKINVAF